MVLHELSHGYHHQFLEGGFDNPRVKAAYEHAMESQALRARPANSGQEEKAYAATNPMEYFAEASEAYFGTNDFFPFVRIELKRHDPSALRDARGGLGGEAAAAGRNARPGREPRSRPSVG